MLYCHYRNALLLLTAMLYDYKSRGFTPLSAFSGDIFYIIAKK